MLKHIERVSVDQVSTVGRKLFAMEHLAITGLGPVSVKSLESYR
jgi:hypothetical protein